MEYRHFAPSALLQLRSIYPNMIKVKEILKKKNESKINTQKLTMKKVQLGLETLKLKQCSSYFP